MQQINKNISVWRGNNTPPTDYHLWEKEDGSLCTKINEEWKELGSPSITDKIKYNILDLGTFTTSKEAEEKAADQEICRNTDVVIILYKVDKINGVIFQSVGEQYTLQNLLLKSNQYYRKIPVNGQPGQWVRTGMDTLRWNTDENKYDFYWLDTKVAGHTDSIPIANNKNAGLLDSELYNKFNNSINKITITSTDQSTQTVYTIKSTNNNNVTSSGAITVPKDSSVKDVQILDTHATIDYDGNLSKGDPEGDTALCIVYLLQDQSYKLAKIDLQKFLEECEFKDGLQVNEHKVRVKVNSESDPYLSVDENGIKLSGLKDIVENVRTIYRGNPQLVKPQLTGNWTIYKNDGTTVVAGLSFPLEYGYKAQYIGTWMWKSETGKKDPTSTNGAWGTALPKSGVCSSELTSGLFSENKTLSQTIFATKQGLMVSGSDVVPAQGDDSSTVSVSCSFSYKVFYGATSSNSASNDTLSGLQNQLSGKSMTIQGVTTNVSQYYWYAYPKKLGELTSIVQNGAAPVLDDFTKYECQYTSPSGAIFDYYVYISNNKGAFTNVSLTFK